MGVDEARQHEVRAGAEHPVERPLLLELRARAGGDDRRPLDDERAVRDECPGAERDDRVAEDERAHRASYVGTTMRSSTAWNARFASCSTLGSSIVVNAWSRYTILPSTIVVFTALPFAANTRCE